jgi:hypothetical protein
VDAYYLDTTNVFWIFVREKRRGNQEWTVQRHEQHWAQHTE